MKKSIIFLLGLCIVLVSCLPDRDDESESENDGSYNEDDQKRPYSFAYTASRHYNGAPDREHKEERGADGITRGVFRFVDPRYQIQEVIYTSDVNGFHVNSASNTPQDTPVVKAAKKRHFLLYEKIRQEHARLSEELAEKYKIYEANKKEREKNREVYES